MKKFLSNNFLGALAEIIALSWMYLKGYRFIKWRYKNRYGEIDLLMRKFDSIVAVEVKYRKNKQHLKSAINYNQKLRIKNALKYFISNSKTYYGVLNYRFDAILISKWKMRHIKNVWGE